MPLFKIDANGSTTNTVTGKTFRYRKNEPVYVSESDLAGLKHMRSRMIEVRPVMFAPEPIYIPEKPEPPVQPVQPVQPEPAQEPAKPKRGRPKKTE